MIGGIPLTESVRVVIADNQTDFTGWLSGEFLNDGTFDLVGIAADGVSACEKVRRLLPDLLLIELVLPRLDGIAVIEELRRMAIERTPYIIVMSAAANEDVISQAILVGASGFLEKPFSLSDFKEMVLRAMRSWPVNSDEAGERMEFIRGLLRSVGIPENIKGFRYLCDAILSVSVNIDLLDNVTNKLYRDIAARHGSKAGRVERSIRHAVEAGWIKGKISVLDGLFGYTVDSSKGKPTNSEFIAMLAERVRLRDRT